MRQTPLEEQVYALCVGLVESMGYDIVRVKLADMMGRRTLQFMIERKDGAMLQVEDCTDVSHAVSALLDVEDPITGAYDLEVSSPGVDRPLTRRKDFEMYAGFEAKLESVLPVNSRKRYRGMLRGVEGNDVVMFVDGTEYRIALDNVAESKLIMNDALMKAYTERPSASEDGAQEQEIDAQEVDAEDDAL